MNIITIGAGDVGFQLVKRLCVNHDVILIESNPLLARRASEQLDAHVVQGNGIRYTLLREAGLHTCDCFVAVTNNDELNILGCQIAKHAGVDLAIARARNAEYTQPDFVIPTEQLGPDMIIHPEQETGKAILRLIRQTAASDIFQLGEGRIQVTGIRLEDDSPLMRKKLEDLQEEFGHLPMRVVGIQRKESTRIPNGQDFLLPGDQIFICSQPDVAGKIIEVAGNKDVQLSNIMVLGGGLIGQYIARELGREVRVKIVESSRERSEQIADLLPDSLVIHGDGTDIDLLAVEGITDMDLFISVTGNDETNIITSLVATHLEVPRTIALVNNMDYIPITPSIGMGAVVSKQLLTVNAVQRYILRQRQPTLANIRGSDTHFLEYTVPDRAKITRKPLMKIVFPRDAMIGAVIRGEDVIIATGPLQIKPGDRVFVFALPTGLKEVEKLFR